MCSVCGCGAGETRFEEHHHHHDGDHGGGHEHHLPDGTVIRHGHHGHDDHAHDQSRLIRIEQDILAKNDAFAAANRQLFEATGTLVLNLMSSPGSGKTTLLARTLTDLKGTLPLAV